MYCSYGKCQVFQHLEFGFNIGRNIFKSNKFALHIVHLIKTFQQYTEVNFI